MKQRPVAIGLILCEQVVIEEGTRNPTLVNCFNRRVVAGFPSEPFAFTVFATLTDGLGEVPLEIRIYRLDNLEEIYLFQVSHQFTSPLNEVRFTVRLRNCSFPVPGQYEVSLIADDESIARRRLHITQQEDRNERSQEA